MAIELAAQGKPTTFCVDTVEMALEMERLHYTRYHPGFLGSDFGALPMEAHLAVAATRSKYGAGGAGSSSPLSPEEDPPSPFPPRMGNQSMKSVDQTPAEWVVESFEINHILRDGTTETVCARTAPPTTLVALAKYKFTPLP